MELVNLLKEMLCFPDLNKTKCFFIALSGGLDSTVLLHVFSLIAKEQNILIKAIYINHHLSPLANVWQKHCNDECAKLNIPFAAFDVVIDLWDKQGIEASARSKRYQLFKSLLRKNDCLVSAHHENDQAETVLLQLLRGSSPKGLSAMPPIKKWGKGFHVRPFLTASKKTLAAYAKEHKLSFIQDESNNDPRFMRNYLRHQVFPVIEKQFPAVFKTLARSARLCAAHDALLTLYTEENVKKVQEEETLSLKKLRHYSLEQQKHIVRQWIYAKNYLLPSEAKMQQIFKTLICARVDKLPQIKWGGIVLRRYQEKLYLSNNNTVKIHKANVSWDINTPLHLDTIGLLHASKAEGVGLLKTNLQNINVSFRKGGEYCRLPERIFHHKLKKLMQDWKILPWQRNYWPLLYIKEHLIMVPPYFIAENFITKSPDESGWKITFTPYF